MWGPGQEPLLARPKGSADTGLNLPLTRPPACPPAPPPPAPGVEGSGVQVSPDREAAEHVAEARPGSRPSTWAGPWASQQRASEPLVAGVRRPGTQDRRRGHSFSNVRKQLCLPQLGGRVLLASRGQKPQRKAGRPQQRAVWPIEKPAPACQRGPWVRGVPLSCWVLSASVTCNHIPVLTLALRELTSSLFSKCVKKP